MSQVDSGMEELVNFPGYIPVKLINRLAHSGIDFPVNRLFHGPAERFKELLPAFLAERLAIGI